MAGEPKKNERFKCTECDRVEPFTEDRFGSANEKARVAGWRLGTNGRGENVRYCPECSGVDEEYWDRRTLNVAYMAGIDAGNEAWGPVT